MVKLNRMIACLVVILSMSCLISGCEKKSSWENWTTQQMSVEKNGQVICCVVDSFDKNFYDLDELSGMAIEEVKVFNAAHKSGDSTPAVVEEVKRIGEAENFVRVVYRFDKGASFSSFFEESFFYGTLKEASESRLFFTGTVLHDGKKDYVMNEANQKKYASRHVIVTDVKTVIHLPYKVFCFSPGVKLLQDGSVDLSECQETAIILLEK